MKDDEPRPPREGNQPERPYFVHLSTRHAQWERPFHRILLEITRNGYQANMSASSMRGLLGFDACYYPPRISDILTPPAAAKKNGGNQVGVEKTLGAVNEGGKGLFMAQSAPRVTWAAFKEVLTKVVAGLVGVDLEYVPEEDGEGGQEEEEKPAVRVANDEAWQGMLEYLRNKSPASPGELAEAEVDLMLLKSGK